MKTDAKLHPSAEPHQIFERKSAFFGQYLTLVYVYKYIFVKLNYQ